MESSFAEHVSQIVKQNITSLPLEFADFETDLSQMGMDSIVFIRIVVAFEDVFEIEVPDEKLLITEMNTINKMIEVVTQAINTK